MKTIGQPDIYVDCKAASADCLDRFLAYGNRMVPERAPEVGIQTHTVLPKGWLIIVDDTGKGDGILDKSAIVPRLCPVSAIGEEGQSTGGNAPGLFCHKLVGLSACSQAHAAHP